MPSSFKKANKSAVFLKLAITGPSGSGKTTAALRMARGLIGKNGRIAVIDTENSSSLLYADTYEFDVCTIEPPYTDDKFIKAICDAEDCKYDCIIIDSFSHVWQAILEYKSKLDMRGGNSYTNWANAGNRFESVLQAVLNSKTHIICCMRSKMDYAIDTDDKGKKSIRKVGLAPIMRDGIEFEFSLVLDLDMNHKAIASKDRTRLFDGKIEEITELTGEILNDWRLGKKSKNTQTSQDSQSSQSSQNFKSIKNSQSTKLGETKDDIPMDFPDDIVDIIKENEAEANVALKAWGWIKPTETWRNLSAEHIVAIKGKPNEFLAKAIEVAKQIGREN